jgi:hypothetical protein
VCPHFRKRTASAQGLLYKSLIFWRNRGAQGRDRTTDTVIFSHVLYQLSYLGAGPAGAGIAERRAL